MLLKIIYIVSVISTHIILTKPISVLEFNRTAVQLSIELKSFENNYAGKKEVTSERSWTVILNRMDGSEIFHRNWNAYKNGFGNLDGEFFLGLEKIHKLTAKSSQELLVILEDFEGEIANETYERFGIAGEDEQYALTTLGKAEGTAGDSLRYNHGMKFTTFDRDNDILLSENCAAIRTGGWWFKDCSRCNLAGDYHGSECGTGVNWYSFRNCTTSLKRAVMMIRPIK